MVLITILIPILLGVFFFLSEYFEFYTKLRIHRSFIAGASLAYFFFVVLPEIEANIPEFPLHLQNFEYLFVLLGFAFNHIAEKIILQKVEIKSIESTKDLIKKESYLEIVEDNLENTLENELLHDKIDINALKEIAGTIKILKDESNRMKKEIETEKQKISIHIAKDIEEFRFFTQFFYHSLVGILLVGVIGIDVIAALLIFVFAFLMTLITYHPEKRKMFSEVDIEIRFHEKKLFRSLGALSVPFGVFVALIYSAFVPIDLESVYLIFSFIMGVIMYTIIREVVPENEIGQPLYFFFGMLSFSLLIWLFSLLQLHFYF